MFSLITINAKRLDVLDATGAAARDGYDVINGQGLALTTTKASMVVAFTQHDPFGVRERRTLRQDTVMAGAFPVRALETVVRVAMAAIAMALGLLRSILRVGRSPQIAQAFALVITWLEFLITRGLLLVFSMLFVGVVSFFRGGVHLIGKLNAPRLVILAFAQPLFRLVIVRAATGLASLLQPVRAALVLVEFCEGLGFAASATAFRGIMGLHQNLHSGDTPPAGTNSAGAFVCANYSIGAR